MASIDLDGHVFDEAAVATEAQVPGVDGLFAVFAVKPSPDEWGDSGPTSQRVLLILPKSQRSTLANVGFFNNDGSFGGAQFLKSYRKDGETMMLGFYPMPGQPFHVVGALGADLSRKFKAVITGG